MKKLKEIIKGIKIKVIIKIILVFVLLGIIGSLTVTGINLYMTMSVKKDIITVEDAKDLNYDCIIVLGCLVRPDGTPSWMLEDRLIVGNKLYNANAAPKIIMSGDHGTESYDEVNNMKQYSIDSGIASEDIFMDHAGFETYDTIYRAKEVFGAKKVVIVTQKYHLYRAMYIAKSIGLDAKGVSADLRDYSKLQYYREAREWLARVKSFGKCLMHSKPKYLGDKIDITASGDVTNDK